jgi:hypothetical protein
MKQTIRIEHDKILVVEGTEDALFFEALIQHIKLSDIQVMGIGGKIKIRDNLKALVQTSDFLKVVRLGIIRDADENPINAFQSVQDALRFCDLSPPTRSGEFSEEMPRVGILILPNESNPGALEDICLEAIEKDQAMPCVNRYFECLRNVGLSLPTNQVHLSKVKVQVFLSSRSKSGLRLGEAAKAGYWPWDEASFNKVKIFLQLLSS